MKASASEVPSPIDIYGKFLEIKGRQSEEKAYHDLSPKEQGVFLETLQALGEGRSLRLSQKQLEGTRFSKISKQTLQVSKGEIQAVFDKVIFENGPELFRFAAIALNNIDADDFLADLKENLPEQGNTPLARQFLIHLNAELPKRLINREAVQNACDRAIHKILGIPLPEHLSAPTERPRDIAAKHSSIFNTAIQNKSLMGKWETLLRRSPERTELEVAENVLRNPTANKDLLSIAIPLILGDKDYIEIPGVAIIARAPDKEGREEKLRFYSPTRAKLGQGGYNVIYKRMGLAIVSREGKTTEKNFKSYVERALRTDKSLGERALKQVQQGEKTLEWIHGQGVDIPGIVKSSERSFMKFYEEGPLLSFFITKNSDPKEVFAGFANLMKGLSMLAHFRIFHTDIKLENIFVDKAGNCYLGDFDGAVPLGSFSDSSSIEEIYDWVSEFPTPETFIATGPYFTYTEYAVLQDLTKAASKIEGLFQKAVEEGDLQKAEGLAKSVMKHRQAIQSHVEKMQVFQAGITLYYMLTNKINKTPLLEPISTAKIEAAVKKHNLNPEAEEQLILFLESTVGKSSRISASEAEKQYQAFLTSL